MNNILITGGSGFIGTNLVDKLLENEYKVLNIDKSKPKKEGHLQYWTFLDILNYVELENIVLKFQPEIIIHLAAVTDLDGDNLNYYKSNIEGTENIIKVSKKISSLKKIIFTSSMYVCKPGYVPESYEDYKPHTIYGESKIAGEKLVKAIKDPNFSWTIIRPTSIWGPWFHVPYIDFFNIVYQGKYFDFGRTCTKTYGYVENTVYQIQKLITSDKVHGKTFYLGDKPPIQISEWANEISIEMNKGQIKKVPFILMKFAALIGDAFAKCKVKFPITSFRLNNMTTDNVLPLQDLFDITGPMPISRLIGVRRTIKWLIDYKGYKL